MHYVALYALTALKADAVKQRYPCNRPWRFRDVFPVRYEQHLHIKK
jgi:hypothetical protein